jgi:uncharacterized protein (TIGR03089 family)
LSVTEKLLRPLLAEPARPLITHYDEALGSRIELSRASIANWAAKTANWLVEEHDIEPGSPVAVRLPAHWQTVGVLLGAWWAGAHVLADPAAAEVAFLAPGEPAEGAAVRAVVALDPLGRGLATAAADGELDYLNEIRVHGDTFTPHQTVPGDTPALLESTVDELVEQARAAAPPANSRVLSTVEWSLPDGVLTGLLAVLAAGGSVVQCGAEADEATLAHRADTERTTRRIPA